MAAVDVSGWSLMAVTVGETRRGCCVGRFLSASGEGAGRFSAGAGLGSGSCTVAVGCGAGVAVLLGVFQTLCTKEFIHNCASSRENLSSVVSTR